MPKYSILQCGHCEKVLEGGPMKDASWVWCGFCQKPIHNKYPCRNKCPKSPAWDIERYKDWVEETVGVHYLKD